MQRTGPVPDRALKRQRPEREVVSRRTEATPEDIVSRCGNEGNRDDLSQGRRLRKDMLITSNATAAV